MLGLAMTVTIQGLGLLDRTSVTERTTPASGAIAYRSPRRMRLTFAALCGRGTCKAKRNFASAKKFHLANVDFARNKRTSVAFSNLQTGG
jgi:hypothetical protein